MTSSHHYKILSLRSPVQFRIEAAISASSVSSPSLDFGPVFKPPPPCPVPLVDPFSVTSSFRAGTIHKDLPPSPLAPISFVEESKALFTFFEDLIRSFESIGNENPLSCSIGSTDLILALAKD